MRSIYSNFIGTGLGGGVKIDVIPNTIINIIKMINGSSKNAHAKPI